MTCITTHKRRNFEFEHDFSKTKAPEDFRSAVPNNQIGRIENFVSVTPRRAVKRLKNSIFMSVLRSKCAVEARLSYSTAHFDFIPLSSVRKLRREALSRNLLQVSRFPLLPHGRRSALRWRCSSCRKALQAVSPWCRS